MNVEDAGKKIDSIEVSISYRIIELFSAGLYSSPNKAFEELVCNSYDAFADKVAVCVSQDLTVEGAFIWVCDNGESMNQDELKELWKVGASSKRIDNARDQRRLQIGQFGIGKLATYVLCNKLTFICKKDGRYLATTMDYQRIKKDEGERILLDERELSESEARTVLSPFTAAVGTNLLPFDLFGADAPDAWTFSLLTSLKPKAAEIKDGRLKWVLRTALPLNPQFDLLYNGAPLDSSKIDRPISKTWIMGKDDDTAQALAFAQPRQETDEYFVDFDNLKGVHGSFDLYEDSLVDGSKSTDQGRSHGIFLMVRGRLINIDDPLLGMESFSHGAFNRTRIIVHADGLDNNLTSTRESIKESVPLWQLKKYLQSKFNNEVRKHYFEEELKKEQERSLSHRMSQTSLTLSKRPLIVFAEKYFAGLLHSPFLIEKPDRAKKDELLRLLKEELTDGQPIIKGVEWSILSSGEPIAKLDLHSGQLKMNLMHPYIANYNDAYKSRLPLEFMAVTEVLTEAYLYEQGLDEATVNFIMRRRDNTLRELCLSDREGAPAVAQMLKDSIADSTGLEEAVYRAVIALGFEVTKIGGNGKPDGKADALLGFSESEKSDNFSFIYDAKSTGKPSIAAATAKTGALTRFRSDYKADYAIIVAVDFEGANDANSAISKECSQQKITPLRVADLIRIVLLSAPKQLGLTKLKALFANCHTPLQVTSWITELEATTVTVGPFKEILTTIYELQKNDTEPPEIASVRIKLMNDFNVTLAVAQLTSLIRSLNVFVPGFISIEGTRVGIKARPEKVLEVIRATIPNVPGEIQQLYLDAFASGQPSTGGATTSP